MALSQKSCALLLVFVAAVCIQFYQAHAGVIIGRCMCHETVKYLNEDISDFQVLEKRPACDRMELYVTLNKTDSSNNKLCLNTELKLGKAFLRCWEIKNKNESRKMECIDMYRKSMMKRGGEA